MTGFTEQLRSIPPLLHYLFYNIKQLIHLRVRLVHLRLRFMQLVQFTRHFNGPLHITLLFQLPVDMSLVEENLNVIFSFCREINGEKKNFCLVTNPRKKLKYRMFTEVES